MAWDVPGHPLWPAGIDPRPTPFDSKAWFVGLLLLGIFNLGFFAMVAYVVAAPSEPSRAKRHDTQAVVPA